MKVYSSVEELIGQTPLLRLGKIEKSENLNVTLLGKLEAFNPGGSAKDRVALQMIEDAEKNGLLTQSSTIIEPTSGNTGIGLALMGVARGYSVVIVMPDSMSVERQLLMKAYGAKLVLTPGKEGMTGAIKKAEELAKEIPNSFIPGQFINPSNSKAHYVSTGPEIWNDTDGKVDIFVASIGTGGTITGTGRYLKEKNPNIQIIGVEPASSPFLTKGVGGSHKIQGIGAGFIPEVLDTSLYNEVIAISDEDALSTGRRMASEEGFLVGISSGATLKAAIEVAKRPENKGKTIVALFTDTGERYLSSEMFS